MRMNLNESEIRRLVRSGIAKRMMSEAAPLGDPSGPTFSGLAGALFGMGGGERGGEVETAAGRSEEPLYKPSGRREGQDPVSAIAEVIGAEVGRDKRGFPVLDVRTGLKIKAFIEGMQFIETPFVPASGNNILAQWKEAAQDVPAVSPINEAGVPEGDPVDFPPTVEGLLRYLVMLKTAETGLAVTLKELQGADSVYSKEIKPRTDTIIGYTSYSTSISEVGAILDEVISLVQKDNEELLKSKMLLADFSKENGTARERLGYLGSAAVAAAGIAIIYFTGGLALPAAQGIVAALGVGGSVGISLGISLTTVSLIALVGGAVAAWGVKDVYTSASDMPVSQIIYIIDKSPDDMDELARELERIMFLSNIDSQLAEDAASAIRKINSTDAKKSEVLKALRDARGMI
jgi:hypothetical protein